MLVSKFPAKSGCYIIRDGSRVLYVGQSRNMKKRWTEHHRREFIESNFPNASVEIVLHDGDLLQKESDLISKLQPIMNNKAGWQNCEDLGLPMSIPSEPMSAEHKKRLKSVRKTVMKLLGYFPD